MVQIDSEALSKLAILLIIMVGGIMFAIALDQVEDWWRRKKDAGK